MDIYREHFGGRDRFERLALKPPTPKPRPLYPVLTILLLSAFLWALILTPVIWLLR